MNNVKTIFNIKDLENLTGVKSHTIRIWEKRYAILTPARTSSNIRTYDVSSLKKLLNVTLLHKHGYKISKIAQLSDDKITLLVRQIISDKTVKSHAINAFKIAMMNFDQALFLNTYDKLLSDKSFRDVFYEIFIPLLDEIGLLWQSETITPAHEHFISYLIRQKILTNTEGLQRKEPIRDERVFVLFLPMNEIHDLGLMFINYEIALAGYKSIYLGESLPLENLRDIKRHFSHVTFVSYFTVAPSSEKVNPYVADLHSDVLDADSELWLIGRNTQEVKLPPDGRISKFTSIADLAERL